MPRDEYRYPDAMQNLTPLIRAKAIRDRQRFARGGSRGGHGDSNRHSQGEGMGGAPRLALEPVPMKAASLRAAAVMEIRRLLMARLFVLA